MARSFTRASSHYVEANSVTPITTAATFSTWLYLPGLPSSGQIYTFMSCVPFSSGSDTRNVGFDYWNQAGTRRLRIHYTSGGAGAYRDWRCAIDLSTTTWMHICWTGDWSTNPDTIVLKIDDVSQSVTNSGGNNSTPDSSGTHGMSWGRLRQGNGTISDYADCRLAESALWNKVLTDGQITALSKGVSPALVDPSGLLNYVPWLGGVDDRVHGALTNSGSTDTDHPTGIIYPRFGRRIYVPAGGSSPSINLTGQSGTSSLGSLSLQLSSSLSLTGLSATGSIGSLALQASSSLSLTGQEGTGSLGTLNVIAGTIINLTGLEGTGSLGTLALQASSSLNLTGNSATASLGTVTPSLGTINISLTGQYGTMSLGAITVDIGTNWTEITPTAGSWSLLTPTAGSWTIQ